MDKVFMLLILAAVVEAVWESAKMVWEAGKLNVDKLGVLILGVAACISYRVDFLEMAGVGSVPYFGQVLSGILISRGANFVHDFIGGAENLRVRGVKNSEAGL